MLLQNKNSVRVTESIFCLWCFWSERMYLFWRVAIQGGTARPGTLKGKSIFSERFWDACAWGYLEGPVVPHDSQRFFSVVTLCLWPWVLLDMTPFPWTCCGVRLFALNGSFEIMATIPTPIYLHKNWEQTCPSIEGSYGKLSEDKTPQQKQMACTYWEYDIPTPTLVPCEQISLGMRSVSALLTCQVNMCHCKHTEALKQGLDLGMTIQKSHQRRPHWQSVHLLKKVSHPETGAHLRGFLPRKWGFRR